jgi:hypothetical protein
MPRNDTLRIFVHINTAPDVHSGLGCVVVNTDVASFFVDPSVARTLSKQLMISADELERLAAV